MNRIECAAAKSTLEALEINHEIAAPVLTPVLVTVTVAGFAGGAAVGYVQCARHGCIDESGDGIRMTDIREMSVSELLQARQDAAVA
ncbi:MULTISPECIES: hypothetical protein [Amycolatopsis]|jgi:hypothetical protein|uniref:Uncharacterized protein n=2 Tax=Amycolatopsis TaxID=1813 RepID=A0A229TBQ9_9PSEU|nr:hypothetical protein [Amycolatopsis vastitatis]OXM68430.1 hypothetical protein CF165_13030 [Amycolatopsis vastitatis]